MRLLIASLIVALGCYQSGPIVAAQASVPEAYINHVPADCFMVVHEQVSEDAQFVRDYWGDFYAAVQQTRFWEPVLDEIRKEVPADQRAEAEKRFEEVQALVSEIDWAALTGTEVLYTQRMNALANSGLNAFEGAFLFRVAADQIGELQTQLSSLLEYAADFHPALSLERSSLGGIESAKLHIFGVVQVIVSSYQDTIVAAVNPGLHEELLKSLGGDLNGAKLVNTDRFKEVIAELPGTGYETFYMDFSSMFDSIQAGVLRGMETNNPQDLEDAKPIIQMVRDNLLILDRIGSETRVEGARVFNEAIILSAPGWQDTIIGAAMASQDPFDNPLAMLPNETMSFSLTTFLNPGVLYQQIKSEITDLYPEASEAFDTVETQVKAAIDLDLEADILAPWSGEMVAVNLPTVMGRPMPVTLVKLDDEDKALNLVTLATEAASQLAKEAGQPISIRGATGELADSEMVVISHPLLMLAAIPGIVLGTTDGYLMQAFSEEAGGLMLATMQGNHATLAENPRFAAEGLTMDGPTWSMSWTDLSKEGMMMGQQIASSSMMMGLAMAQNPQGGPMVQAVIASLGKLSPALAKLNFRKSKASVGQFDVDGNTFRFTSVVNYVPPTN